MGRKNDSNKKGNNKKKGNTISKRRWITIIVMWTVLLSGSTNLLSDTLLSKADLLVAFVILVIIIFIGVVFDTIGTAVTAATERPFHAMAAKRIHGAKTSVRLIRNADKVSNFCNDVVGDICGIISGSAGVIIASKVTIFMPTLQGSFKGNLFRAGIGALIAAATIGGKAVGKNLAITRSNDIIFKVAQIIHLFKKER